MTQPIKLAITQMKMTERVDENIGRAGEIVAEAALAGANVILLPELFSGQYFPRVIDDKDFELAEHRDKSRTIEAMRILARTHGVVLPVSYFERTTGEAGTFYNTLAMVDADGSVLGHYRKTHIPDGPGYEEKHFFAPGDTGFRVWDTKHGKIGAGICWDQWFPECARAMTLLGADLLLYPTAIGTEPVRSDVDTSAPWRRVMVGHAVANTIPVAASNRVGDEHGQRYYGTSFICDGRGDILTEMNREDEGFAIAELDLDTWRQERDWMALVRDRRPEMYAALTQGAKNS